MTSTELAWYAEVNLLSTNTQKLYVVPENAPLRFVGIKSIKYLGKQDVYNLTVEEHHNYLANDGVLSKNCDTDRYALTCPEVRNVGGTSASFRTHTRH